MPSNAMYLAIAKKYLENHNEENEKEFYKGIVTESEERTHNPDLNKYYREKGLDSSFYRGQFLRLATDCLFYNRFLNSISAPILKDFRRANKKIIDRYGLEISEELERTIRFADGELEVLDEESIYKFIEAVSKLDLEQYAQQKRDDNFSKKIPLIGKKEGLLYKYKGGAFLRDYTEIYFYGFENNYGLLVERTTGGMAYTNGAEEGLYEVTPIGISLKPSEIWDDVQIQPLRESLRPEEKESIVNLSKEEFSDEINANVSLKFQNVSKDKISKILSIVKDLPNRQPQRKITDRGMNLNCLDSDEIFVE